MIKKDLAKKLTAVIMAGAMLVCSAVPAMAAPMTLGNDVHSGTVRVYANVASQYLIQLPASITLREQCYTYEGKSYEAGGNEIRGGYDATKENKFEADYGVNVIGVLLGQKVTLKPTSQNFYMEAYSDAACETPSSAGIVPAVIDQPISEWIPDATGVTAGTGQVKIRNYRLDDDDIPDETDWAGQGHITVGSTVPGNYYKGTVTFEVTCEPYV